MKKMIPTFEADIDFATFLDYTDHAKPYEHEEGCAYGLPDGFSGIISECYCTKLHICKFIKDHYEEIYR